MTTANIPPGMDLAQYPVEGGFSRVCSICLERFVVKSATSRNFVCKPCRDARTADREACSS
jgi:hypothetical protein